MQPDPSTIPPQIRILQLATASWMSQAVSAAAELGIADVLASGPAGVAEIAQAVGAHEPTLYRLLRTCADLGLWEEVSGQRFTLTDVGQALRSDGPASMRNFAIWTGLPAERHSWTDLAESVRTGEPAFAGVHGLPVFGYLQDHPEVLDIFDKAMTEASRQVIAPIVAAYDFSPLRRIVDVGGGRGALLAAILADNPQARGTLFDQPGVIADAGQATADAGVSDRCELVGGDFFAAVPPGGDAYLLSNIIHDWDDKQSGQILANCRNAMADGGRVLLVEAVLPEPGEPELTIRLMDLDMLVLTGGRQRTRTEFGALLERAGLRLTQVVPGGLCSVIEAVRG